MATIKLDNSSPGKMDLIVNSATSLTFNEDGTIESPYIITPPKNYYMGTEVTLNAQFNKTNNTITALNIADVLHLEEGDVIVVSGTTSNNKTFTVESINDVSFITVNYEHRNGTGSLSLEDEGPVICTIKLLCKAFLAPLGLGQDWVNVTPSRSLETVYTNSTGRIMSLSITLTSTAGSGGNGAIRASSVSNISGALFPLTTGQTLNIPLHTEIPVAKTYEVTTLSSISTLNRWLELR